MKRILLALATMLALLPVHAAAQDSPIGDVVDGRCVRSLPAPMSFAEGASDWEKSIAFVLAREGSRYAIDVNGYGVRYGINAKYHPGEDVRNMTAKRAAQIYHDCYWLGIGADSYAWPFNLILFDTAVLHGKGRAAQWLKELGPEPGAWIEKRTAAYTNSKKQIYFRGWCNRLEALASLAAH